MVVRLAGSVPTANSLRLPRRREDSLGAAGRFLYLQLRMEPGKPYAIHADLAAADRGLHRVSVSNLHAAQQGARMKRSGVQVFLPAAHDGWTLLALDLEALAQQAGRSPYARLRALHLCANMTVRGAFTSDVRYDWQVGGLGGVGEAPWGQKWAASSKHVGIRCCHFCGRRLQGWQAARVPHLNCPLSLLPAVPAGRPSLHSSL